MVIDLTAEEEEFVLETAKHEGKTVPQVVVETLQWLVQLDEEDRAAIQRGIEQADRGEFIEEEEMERRFRAMLRH